MYFHLGKKLKDWILISGFSHIKRSVWKKIPIRDGCDFYIREIISYNKTGVISMF